jgi:transcriptional regulator with XRE-family HTH domain
MWVFMTDDDVIAGQRLRALRKRRGFSQAALADAIGISFQQVQKYERGLNRMSVGRINIVANFFNVSVLYFFNGSSEEYEIVKNFYKCTDERRKILLDLAQTYALEEGGKTPPPISYMD